MSSTRKHKWQSWEKCRSNPQVYFIVSNSTFHWVVFFLRTWCQWLSVLMKESERGQSSCCLSLSILAACVQRALACAYVRVWAAVCARAGSCASVSVFVCLVRIDTQTGLISRDLWALTGCRLVSTATSKGWRCFTYPDGALHPRAQRHVAHRSGPTWRRREVPMWSWEWKRGQLAVCVARCLWWVHEEKLQFVN